VEDGAQIAVKLALTPANVVKRLRAKSRKVLYKQGAYLRKAMQRSMRYATKKKQHSSPGQPPLAHRQNPLLRKLITFAVDESAGRVICGPKKFGDGQAVPQLLDKGGSYRPDKKQLQSKFSIGGQGPIRDDGKGGFVYAKLETSAQTQRAVELVVGENQIRAANAAIHIAPRPFTKPILSDGGKNFRRLIETTAA
jgi:hypothetical protein